MKFSGENGPDDGFAPPSNVRDVTCLHCGKTYRSDAMRFEERRFPVKLWWCATPDCDGAGYNFDIFDADDPMVARVPRLSP